MVEHYTRATVEVTVWCNKCRENTRHSAADRRQGSCLVCLAKLNAEKVGREYEYEERAAIREYDGNLTRTEAEAKAKVDVQRQSNAQKELFNGNQPATEK